MLSKVKKIVDPDNYRRLFRYVKSYGIKDLGMKLKSGMREPDMNMAYAQWFDRHKITDEELQAQREAAFSRSPKISILVPTFNTPEEFLRKMIDTIVEQTYSNWELCIADGSTDEHTREVLREYMRSEPRIKVTFLDKNYGISGNTNKALELATGEYIGLLDHDDFVEPDLLYWVANELQDEKVEIVYTDEDKAKLKHKKWIYIDPNFKPDFSIDLFRSHNYITHFFTVSADIMKKVGGFDSEYDGSQDYDLMFRCIEEVWKREGKIAHVAKPLYHWRMHGNSTAEDPKSKLYCYEAGKKAIEAHLNRLGIKAKVEHTDMWGLYHTRYETVGNPLLSIIIPNKDHIDDLTKCIESIDQKSDYKNVEFIVVENNSEEQSTFDAYEELKKKYKNLKVVIWDGPFNFSAINNFGAKYASGEYYLLLNNDTELIEPDSLGDMLGICMRDDVGIVGAKLFFEDKTIQHAGVVLGFGGFAGHVFSLLSDVALGYMMRPRINCNYSAVTGACLMVKKSIFDEVGGLTEEFTVGLNDVDFCLKVRDKGYMVVYDAFAKWFHYESKSRGYDDVSPEKRARLDKEIALFRSYWGELIDAGDPFYNKNFPVTIAPFTLGE